MPTRQRRSSARSRSLARTTSRRARGRAGKKWSQDVTRNSNALDLEAHVFKLRSPKAVAASLKRSALRSKRRKAPPYQSAISMLNFYINRAGKGLSGSQKRVLERAKGELRRAFGREAHTRNGRSRR